MKQYDPLEAPDSEEWLSLDEAERIELAQDYHRRARIRLPNEKVHATLHATVENQIALGDETPVRRTVARLMAEGLDRHEAVHAIGLALVEHMSDVLSNAVSDADPNQRYFAAIERLTAEDWLRAADDSTTDDMDAGSILDDLTLDGRLPLDAISAARAERASLLPLFMQAIEQYPATEDDDDSARDALFLIFHLLGEWREKSAYRPLARLLRRPADEIEAILGDATTETSHRVMAAVFDGDPKPLYDVILDPEADEFIRSRMFDVLAMVTVRGELFWAEAARFLLACYSDIKPQDECYVWEGWQGAIALLGLVEMKSLVERAFRRGYISPDWLSFENFEEDLQRAIEHPAAPWRHEREFSLFGDTIEELSSWAAFRPKDEKSMKHTAGGRPGQWSPNAPAVNRFKGVGRNDPCPCGSGKKFKKCCLNSARGTDDLGTLLS